MIIFGNTFDKKSFDDEIKTLNLILDKQLILKKCVLKYMDKLANSALASLCNTNQNIAYNYLSDIRLCLEKVDSSIDKINELLKFCSKLKNAEIDCSDTCITDYNKNFINYINIIYQNDFDIQELMFKLIDYSKLDFSSLVVQDLLDNKLTSKVTSINQENQNEENNNNLDTTDKFEATEQDSEISKVTNNLEKTKQDSDILNVTNESTKPDSASNQRITTSECSDPDIKENVLFISEVKKIVVLPYTINELDELIKSGKYTSYKEIIDNKYTLPISYFNFASISRFRETYNLVKNRSNGSIKDAFDLGIELFFKQDLNPAIITACRNIDELDIYLACLYDNDLDSFKCFKIVFEGLPTLIKKI